LRLGSHKFSPAILGKIVRAAARDGSFDAAAESLADLAEIRISGRQVGRIAHEVGEQLRHDRDQRVEEFQSTRAKPESPVAPRLAVVEIDGGRLQTRSEEPGKGPGIHDPRWREDKVANLLTMSTQSHDQDPHPELPRCFTKKREVVELVQGIVDFVHVLTHVYLAAKAVGGPAAAVWERYLGWATACWQGRVATVLEQLRAVLEKMPPPPEGQEAKPTDPYEVIRLAVGYLVSNQPRMDYPRYRRAGLPTCSGLVESLVKQFNRRVKGTEKFWNPTQAETILQLRAAYLCEDDRLAKHFKNRPVSPFRRYETTKRRKAG
jgi:hypothetical protein